MCSGYRDFSSYRFLQGEYLRFKISSDIVSDLMMIILMEPMYVGSLAVTEGLRKDGSEELPPGVA